MLTLENIYEKLKKNHHYGIKLIETEDAIIGEFKVFENAKNLLIDMHKYSDEVNLMYNIRSKKYIVISYVHNDN